MDLTGPSPKVIAPSRTRGTLIKVLYNPARSERTRLDFVRRDIWPKAAFLLFFGLICTALLLGYWHRLLR
jgi:hypothetical protein